MDIGLLLVRIVVGALLAGHGAQKLFGWFGGHGLDGTGGFFESLGFAPGRPMAFAGGLGEFGGGLLLAFGLLTPFGAIAAIAVMCSAIASAHRGKGPWVSNGGWELPLTYAAVAAALAFSGPGAASLDGAFGWSLAGAGWGFGAVVVASIAAAGPLTMRASHHPATHEEGRAMRRAA